MGKSRRHGGHCRFTSDCILLQPQGGLVNTQQASLKQQWKFCEIVQGYINTVHIINVILIPPLISLLLLVFLPLICPCHLLSAGLIYRQPSLSSCASGAECVFVCVPMWEREWESRRIYSELHLKLVAAISETSVAERTCLVGRVVPSTLAARTRGSTVSKVLFLSQCPTLHENNNMAQGRHADIMDMGFILHQHFLACCCLFGANGCAV